MFITKTDRKIMFIETMAVDSHDHSNMNYLGKRSSPVLQRMVHIVTTKIYTIHNILQEDNTWNWPKLHASTASDLLTTNKACPSYVLQVTGFEAQFSYDSWQLLC
jgi:hypothetical protein